MLHSTPRVPPWASVVSPLYAFMIPYSVSTPIHEFDSAPSQQIVDSASFCFTLVPNSIQFSLYLSILVRLSIYFGIRTVFYFCTWLALGSSRWGSDQSLYSAYVWLSTWGTCISMLHSLWLGLVSPYVFAPFPIIAPSIMLSFVSYIHQSRFSQHHIERF